MVRAKGVNFRGIVNALERRGGAELRDRVLARVPGEVGEALRNGAIVAGGWYPPDWYDALLESVEAEYPGDHTALRTLTREAVADDLRTIFRIVRWIISPTAALTNATKAMSRYWDGGRVIVREARDGYVHFVFDGYDGFTPRLWDDAQGGMEAVLDLMGVIREPFEIKRTTRPGSLELIIRYRFE